MNDAKRVSVQGAPVESTALMDCGQASKVTKGIPFSLYYELAPPPFDRALIY